MNSAADAIKMSPFPPPCTHHQRMPAMQVTRTYIEDILSTDAWFASLPPAMQQGMLDIASTKRLGKGQSLFSRGDATDGVYCLLEGRLSARDGSEHGDEAVQLHLCPVFWFGEMGLYDKLPRAHHIRAESPALLLWLDNQRLRQLLHEQPSLWFHFGLLLTQKLRLALFALDGRTLQSNELRVARTLLMMAKLYTPGKQDVRLRLPVAQHEVADMLGMSRQTVNLSLQRLKADGLIDMAYNKIEITHMAGLEEKVRFKNWLPVASQ
ncbi:Crp/Fnr family transcriptional regulator [Aquabacterium sp.]|uniref:Crp/Fnr family transcriptional regulator n=1 Tax=Aquabacterium sp. TaxID=1872578 RepID=UPI0040384750